MPTMFVTLLFDVHDLIVFVKKRRVVFVSPFCIGLLASACGSPAQKIEKHLALISAPISAAPAFFTTGLGPAKSFDPTPQIKKIK